jgi:hypothetical protein
MYQLIQLDPPQILRRHPDQLCGIPTRWHVADESAVRAGLSWVPVLDRPEYDPSTQKLVHLPITEGIGYSVADLTEEEIAARIPPVQGVTPLVIIERIVAIGSWETFEAALAAFPSYVEKSFYAATDIKTDHPLFVTYGAQFKTALGLTDEQFTALLTP